MVVVRELQASINTRQALIDDAKINLKDNKIATVLFFIEMQDKEMACVRDLLVKIDEVLRRPVEKQELVKPLDNQSIERDRLNEIGFVLDFVEFISFTFGDKEMMSVIEAVSR
ncbi:hypothetical protein Tco_0534497 [Tanacetum coccineum]